MKADDDKKRAMDIAKRLDAKRATPYSGTHHTGQYHSQEELEDDLLGFGKGDPAFHPDPAEEAYRVSHPEPPYQAPDNPEKPF